MAGSPQQHDANYCGPVTVPTPTHRGLRPLLFTNSVWVLWRPTEFIYARVVKRGLRFYRPYPRRLESLTVCRCLSTKAALSPQLFKDPGTGPELAASRSADRRLSHWANRAAVKVKSGLFHFSMENTDVNENNEYLHFISLAYRQQKLKDIN